MGYRLRIAKDEELLKYSNGEVKVPDTLNFKTKDNVPMRGGIFCQSVFGPIVDYECECGRLKGITFKGKQCVHCKVDVIPSSFRSSRLGHIRCEVPYVNPLAKKFVASILGISLEDLNDILSCELFYILEENPHGNIHINGVIYELVTTREPAIIYSDSHREDREEICRQVLLQYSDYKTSSLGLEETLKLITLSDQPLTPFLRNLLKYNYTATDLLNRFILITPPNTRPMIEMDFGWVLSPINEFYLRILRINQKIKAMRDFNIPEIIIQNEASILQKSVDCLLDVGGKVSGVEVPSIKSNLTSGKTSIFRTNLLGKRTDYSGRSIITSGPYLKLDEVGLPIDMAYVLFQPFIYGKLKKDYDLTHKQAKKHYDNRSELALKVLEEVAARQRVIMNRQPTLHMYGMAGFKPILHSGKNIQQHPMLCHGYGSDFDGDQVSILATLCDEATIEAKTLMNPVNNLLGAANGEPMIFPSQEMVMGLYTMTRCIKNPNRTIIEKDLDRLILRHNYPKDQSDHLPIEEEIYFRYNKEIIITSLGRLLVERIFKIDYGTIKDPLSNKVIKRLIKDCIKQHSNKLVAHILDQIKDISFKYSTLCPVSICVDDLVEPPNKDEKFDRAYQYDKDLKTKLENMKAHTSCEVYENAKDEYRELSLRNWFSTISSLQKEMLDYAGPDNSLVMMYKSGSRANLLQVSQTCVTKGLLAKPDNTISDEPIKNSLRNGLDVFDFWKSTPGSRKAMADKKNVTPVAGFLTRKLVQACRELSIVTDDCGTSNGVKIYSQQALGRYDTNGNLIEKVPNSFFTIVRSPVTCEAFDGICSRCYGLDLRTTKLVTNHTQVGVIAAQSVSEPTTQMSMQSKHLAGAAQLTESNLAIRTKISGVATITEDEEFRYIKITPKEGYSITYIVNKVNCKVMIASGVLVKDNTPLAVYVDKNLVNSDVAEKLPRLTRYYELYYPLGKPGLISPLEGKVYLTKSPKGIKIRVDTETLDVVNNIPILVADGEYVEKGDILTWGDLDLKSFYRISNHNLPITASVFVKRLIDLYNPIDINSKHFEVIFRAMTELVDTVEGLQFRSKVGSNGRIKLFGVSNVIIKSPSWLKSMSYGYANKRLDTAVTNFEVTQDLTTEKIMKGELIFKD